MTQSEIPPWPQTSSEERIFDGMCDSMIEHADTLGLTPRQMAVVCGTLFMNHALATNVSLRRLHSLVDVMWYLRRGQSPHHTLLVKAREG